MFIRQGECHSYYYRDEHYCVIICPDRKFRWIAHILRHESLLRDIIEGRMEKLQEEGNGYKC